MPKDNSATVPDALRPQSGERGLLSEGPTHILELASHAWELFLQGLNKLDLSERGRDRKLTRREQLIPMGHWEDSRGIHQIVADARAGVTALEPFSETRDRLREAHRDDSDQDVRSAVQYAATSVIEWAASSEAAEDAELTTPSPLGMIPVGTYVLAAAFQMAATWRDIAPDQPKPELERLGLTALVDSTGAVAGRLGATASITAITPEGVMGTGAHENSWRTRDVTEEEAGPAVVGPAGLLIDFAAGNVRVLEATRKIRVRQPRRLAAISVVLEGIPDLPAAGMLRRASRMTSFMGR